MSIEPDDVELANPLVAVSRLLATAGAHARVAGDEAHFEVSVALADDDAATIDHAEAWVRWAVHHAGVRGQVERTGPGSPPAGSDDGPGEACG